MESKRSLFIPDRSLGGCPKDTRKLHINFQISTIQESGQTPGFSRAFSKCHSLSLGGHWRFLRGVLVVFDIMDVSRIHQGSYMSIFRYLPSWEVLPLLCVSRASSWSQWGRWWFLKGVFVVYTMVDAPKDTSSKLHINFQISTFLGSAASPFSYVSPEHHHGV